MTQPFTRRALLGTAAAAAVAATVKPVTSFSATRAGRLKLGVASYSLREFSLDQALEMAKTLGVTHITFKDVHLPRTDPPETTRALATKIKAAGITIMGGGTINLPNDAAQIKKDFEYAKNASFPLIFISPDPAALDVVEQKTNGGRARKMLMPQSNRETNGLGSASMSDIRSAREPIRCRRAVNVAIGCTTCTSRI